ncbi:MAG: hypothetical protein KAS49_07805 [Candidatus Cloacimonetes bacterium]|nr:hypothetical protein [Candidatus Cloacimonadota bacterium]
MKESDLFPPIKKYLESAGYTVRAEVNNCDITAIKDDDIIIVEMKLNVNIPLLIQATDRQRISDSVYVAVPAPSNRVQKNRWKGIKHILRRLEIGLIYVHISNDVESIEIIFHPKTFPKRKLSKRRKALIKEMSQRSDNYNLGGISKQKIVTAYRENVIQIAVYLNELGNSSPRNLKKLGTGEKTLSILNSDYYKWFTRIERGVYELNAKGQKEIEHWPGLVEKYKKKFIMVKQND